MKNEEEKNELFTLLCYELHFWYRGILNPPNSKYIVISTDDRYRRETASIENKFHHFFKQ